MRFPRTVSLVASIFLTAAAANAETRNFAQQTAYRPGTLKPKPRGEETLDEEVIAFYKLWHQRFFVSIDSTQAFINVNHGLTGLKPKETYRSVSEGQGYGMLITALMKGAAEVGDTQPDFIKLYNFFTAHPSRPDSDPDKPGRHLNLMAFEQIGSTPEEVGADSPRNQTDSASDGDMDIAYALLLAEKLWPNAGYGARAAKVLEEVMLYDVQQDSAHHASTIKFGDAIVDGPLRHATRSSDFLVQHWRTFANVTGDLNWEALRSNTYQLLANGFANFAPKTGLMPDFFQRSPMTFYPHANQPGTSALSIYRPPVGKILESRIGDGNWSYNACRTPWRLATDYLMNYGANDGVGEATRAYNQLEVLNTWIQRTTTPRLDTASASGRTQTAFRNPDAAPDPARINAGYFLSGAPIHPEISDHGSCFNGPLAVSAMIAPSNQAWLDALWLNLLDGDANDTSGTGEEEYYRATVKLLCMIVLSGHWWDPQPTPVP